MVKHFKHEFFYFTCVLRICRSLGRWLERKDLFKLQRLGFLMQIRSYMRTEILWSMVALCCRSLVYHQNFISIDLYLVLIDIFCYINDKLSRRSWFREISFCLCNNQLKLLVFICKSGPQVLYHRSSHRLGLIVAVLATLLDIIVP